MNEIKRNNRFNEFKNPYRSWSRRTFNNSLSRENFIVPWQIYDSEQDHSVDDKASDKRIDLNDPE